MKNNHKYCEYFDVDEKFFSCVDESAINSGQVQWEATYPHETFVDLLKRTELMLGGSKSKSIWIRGDYGTGKSLCAYTLKKILEEPKEKVETYWDSFDSLKKNKPLLAKLLGHRDQGNGVVVAWRYASGDIFKPKQLFRAVQESVAKALEARGLYTGANTLKESVIAWLESPENRNFLDAKLKKSRWTSIFDSDETTSEEILKKLNRKNGNVSSLMNNILELGEEEGITAFDLTADRLCDWIRDVVDENDIKLILLWDEFSDYFRNNKTSLGEFQKIATICQEKPFYFMIVTHLIEATSYSAGGRTNEWALVKQRFDIVDIELPDSIAFDLIGQAFTIKKDGKGDVKRDWERMVSNLANHHVSGSLAAVAEAAGIKDVKTVQKALPIHPMAALSLKHIATAFDANQRSLFNFIKASLEDTDAKNVKAFQWFIHNAGPNDRRPFLTISMLWDFLYEKGKDSLNLNVRRILDAFPQNQGRLDPAEQEVLKTILIMLALDAGQRDGVPILKPTDKNLGYAFEGDEQYELCYKWQSIAKGIVNKGGILVESTVGKGVKAYNVAVLGGDNSKIEDYQKKIRSEITTDKLVAAAPGLGKALGLSMSPALKLRYPAPKDKDPGCLQIVTKANFTKVMTQLRDKEKNWRFLAVLALAKSEEEGATFRKEIKTIIARPEYCNVVVIDALSAPLDSELLDEYVQYSAFVEYYQGNNKEQSVENANKARGVLEEEWGERIKNGMFTVWTYDNPTGEQKSGAAEVRAYLQELVCDRFPCVQDFNRGAKEAQLNPASPQFSNCALSGVGVLDEHGNYVVKGVMVGADKTFLGNLWNRSEYWNAPDLESEPLVVVKKALNSKIKNAFKEGTGRIEIGEIWKFVEDEFGFSESPLSAFLLGFLLREYSSDQYRFEDSEGHREPMTREKLATTIAAPFAKQPKPCYIVNQTPEEKAFYELTERVWDLRQDECTSPSHAGTCVSKKMREIGYPVWCLEELDRTGIYELLDLYIQLVQKDNDKADDVANRIGKYALAHKNCEEKLKALLAQPNPQEGTRLFLERFEAGRLWQVAAEIQAQNAVLNDVKGLFNVEHSALWLKSTGEDEIRKLLVEYEVVALTNKLLNVSASSKKEALDKWRETLNFIGFSGESFASRHKEFTSLVGVLLRICRRDDIRPEMLSDFLQELRELRTELQKVLDAPLDVFKEIYAPYLEGFSDVECEGIMRSIGNVFLFSPTESNDVVNKAAKVFRKNQAKTRLDDMWRAKAGCKTPFAWSAIHRTPILICVPESLYNKAKSVFAVINEGSVSDSDIQDALEFVENANFFDSLNDKRFVDAAFVRRLLGEYAPLFSDLDDVRTKLEQTGVPPYGWCDDPTIYNRIREIAEAEYNAGGSDSVVKIVMGMKDEELKKWLINLVCRDMELGLRIVANKENA